MKLLDSSVGVEGDRKFVRFTRPFETGHHNISTDLSLYPMTIIWALGSSPSACTGSPGYHGNTRGTRVINWKMPSLVLNNFMKCEFA